MHKKNLAKIWPEWQILDPPIGTGSFGTVYKAVRRDALMESYSAIKVISIPKHPSDLESLRALGYDNDRAITYLHGIVNDCVSEIQLMENLKGIQNIVSVEDYKIVEKIDQIGWDIYIRMELLTPLTTYIANNQLSENDVIKLGCDICSALEVCSKKGIIHRDIKPENIFVNEFGDFKLGDFGIARTLEGQMGNMSMKGTPNYMAPEVANSKEYDSRVDTYSLGIVLYLFLNQNRLPFLSTEKTIPSAVETANASARRLRGEKIPAPVNASSKLASVVLRACAYNPNARFQDATQMKQALLEARDERPQKPRKRGWRAALVAIMALLLLLGAGAGLHFSGMLSKLPIALEKPAAETTEAPTGETEVAKESTEPIVTEPPYDKEEALNNAKLLYAQGDLLEAILAVDDMLANLGEDIELTTWKEEMEVAYIDQVVQYAEDQLFIQNYDDADTAVSKALRYFPENEALISLYARIQYARPVYLLDEVAPYKTTARYDAVQTLAMDGKNYKNGFTTKGYGAYNEGNQVYFNLDGNYSMISFTAGIVTNRNQNVTFLFHADGELVYKFTMKKDDTPSNHIFNIVGCKQFVVSVHDGTSTSDRSGTYALADIMVTRSVSSIGKEDIQLREDQVYLLEETKPYITPSRYESPTTLNMGGQKFTNGFSCMGYGTYNVGNKVYFNLDGNYSRMSFAAGIVLDQGLNVTYRFYTDGVLAYELKHGESDLASNHSFSVEGCKQLMICICDGKLTPDASGTYGIANIIMDKSSTYSDPSEDAHELEEGETYLLSAVKPHTVPTRYNDSDILSMGGHRYRNGFSCMGYGEYNKGNEVCFSLDGKYKEISFVAGIVLDRAQKVTFRFQADGVTVYEFTMEEGDLPAEHTFSVEGCSELVISVWDKQRGAETSGTYGLANIVVTE